MGIALETLRHWVKQSRDAGQLVIAERERMRQMEKENALLRKENEIQKSRRVLRQGDNEKKVIFAIHHSDHGSQYRSLLLGKTMRAFGIVPSVGSIASPWDNAVTESLMSTIKAECIDNQTYETRDIARLEIFDYIERFYNRVRLHSGIGYMSPVEYENKMLGSALSA